MALNPSVLDIGQDSFEVDINVDRQLLRQLAGRESVRFGQDDFKPRLSGVARTLVVDGPGAAIIAERSNPGARGAYFVASDDDDDQISLPSPLGNNYYATVLLRVADPQHPGSMGSFQPGAQYQVYSGTQATSPTPASDATINAANDVPGGWARIADVLINVGETGTIPAVRLTDRRPFPLNGQAPWINGLFLGPFSWPAGVSSPMGSLVFTNNDTSRFSSSGTNQITVLKDGWYRLSGYVGANQLTTSFYSNLQFTVTPPSGRAGLTIGDFAGSNQPPGFDDKAICEPRVYLFAGTTIWLNYYSNQPVQIRSASLNVEAILL